MRLSNSVPLPADRIQARRWRLLGVYALRGVLHGLSRSTRGLASEATCKTIVVRSSTPRCRAIVLWTAAVAAALSPPALGDGALSDYREYEPVVIEATLFGDWVGSADLTELNVFRYNSDATWTAIPYQIDKRRKINLKNNLADPNDIAGTADVCEYGYFRELSISAGGAGDTFASDTLHATDELVFLLKDAGSTQAPRTSWLSGDVSDVRREITLTDPRTAATRFVYVFNFYNGIPGSGTDARSTNRYVTYTEDNPHPSGCFLTTCSNCTEVYPCGTVEGSSTHLGGLQTHKVHYLKNWVTDGYRTKTTGSFLDELLQRFEYSMEGENEDGWSTAGRPRTLGVYPTSGSTENLVRVVRGIQGAASGRHTTKYEFVYPIKLVTRVNVRVHPIPSLESKLNHDVGMINESTKTRLWTLASYSEPTPLPKDDMNGAGFQTEEKVSNNYADWSEVSSFDRGRYIHFLREPRPIPRISEYYTYQDKLSQARIGMFGRLWEELGNMQDGKFNIEIPGVPPLPINDGGCGPDNDPESTALNFARIEHWMFPKDEAQSVTEAANVLADNLYPNVLQPITFSVRAQSLYTNDPPPPSLCTPSLTASGNANGATSLVIGKTGCDESLSYRLYRGEGSSGPLYLLKDLAGGASWLDIAVHVGATHRYAVTAYSLSNAEGSLSTPTSVTVSDTTAPAAPVPVDAVAGNGTATARWNRSGARDISGYDIYMSIAGGAYTKLNGAPHSASSNAQWTQLGLSNGVEHCFKLVAIDQSGNASGLSSAACTTPTQ